MEEFAYFIHEAPLILIAGILFVGQVLARELGGWARRRMAGGVDEAAIDSADKSFVLSGMLGLLALLIAFTFSLSMDRYEGRRQMVIDEANAIGTAEMRVRLLPPPQGEQLASMLRAYARTRLAYGLASAADKPALAQSAARQRDRLQAAALSALGPVAATPLGPFVGQSINEVLDIGAAREALNAAVVPVTALRALMLYTLLTAAVLGFSLGGSGTPHRPATFVLFALLTLAILLILDLDRPQGGTIHTDQTPMVRLIAGFPSTAMAQRPAASPTRPKTN